MSSQSPPSELLGVPKEPWPQGLHADRQKVKYEFHAPRHFNDFAWEPKERRETERSRSSCLVTEGERSRGWGEGNFYLCLFHQAFSPLSRGMNLPSCTSSPASHVDVPTLGQALAVSPPVPQGLVSKQTLSAQHNASEGQRWDRVVHHKGGWKDAFCGWKSRMWPPPPNFWCFMRPAAKKKPQEAGSSRSCLPSES